MRSIFSILALLFAFHIYPQSRLAEDLSLWQYGTADSLPSVPRNPALLGRPLPFSLIVQAGTSFMLHPVVSLSAVIPTSAGSFHGRAGYRGSSLHSESDAEIGYGRKLTETITAGIGFGYYQTSIPGYIKAGEASISGGLFFRLSKELITGMNIRKRVRFSTTENLGAPIYQAGLGYTVSDILLVAVEAEKEDGQSPSFRSGLHYKFHKNLFASLGFVAGNGSWFFGSRVQLSSYTAEARFVKHPFLGWSPSITLFFQRKNKSNATR